MMRAREWLRQRPGQLEQLEAQINNGAWSGRLNVFFQSHVALASATDEWHEIDKSLRRMVSNWSDDQLGVIPLPPIAKREGSLIETQTPIAAENLRQASTLGAAPLMEAPVNAVRHAVIGAKFAMKRSALIKEHQHEWPTIATNIAGANRNGLAAAKAGARGWLEDVAMEWARNNGKLKSKAQPSDTLTSAMHKMSDLPAQRHQLEG